ncbi:iron-siderophore ABC transporter substrate-binding protein [Phormidesmis sp. 146-35]
MRRLIFVLLMLFTLGQTVGCHATVRPVVQTACYEVKHAVGSTCVPRTIQRLVTLDSVSFEDAIALGFKPVGTVLAEQSTPYLDNQQLAATNIGQMGTPNLERILALHPDLIVGLDYHKDIYAQLSQIAPTLLLEFGHSGEWKSSFQNFSDALNRSAIAQQIMQAYSDRLQTFRSRLKSARPKISVVRMYPDSLSLYLRDSFAGVILNDAGLDRPPSQNLSASEAQAIFGNDIQAIVSVELIEQADGDILFVWTSENTAAADETAQKKLIELRSSRLWKGLKAVQNNQVYQVPNYWIGSGPLAANAVIDDLFRYIP